MQIGVVKEIALVAPHLVIHMLPFGARVDVGLHGVELQRASLSGLRRPVGRLEAGPMVHWLCLAYSIFSPSNETSKLVTPSRIWSVLRVFRSNLWKVVDGPAPSSGSTADLPRGRSRQSCPRQGSSSCARNGQGKNPLADVFEIDVHLTAPFLWNCRRLFLCLFSCLFPVRLFFFFALRFLAFFLVAFRRQRRGFVFLEDHDVHAAVTGRCMLVMSSHRNSERRRCWR